MLKFLPKLSYFAVILLLIPERAYAMHIMKATYLSGGPFFGGY